MSVVRREYIWDFKTIPLCTKVPEDVITLEEIRDSSGFKTDPETGLRIYFVPSPN